MTRPALRIQSALFLCLSVPFFHLFSMSGEPVKLYIYDLSQGMARQMSQAMTGKQIDGIWHTSVVVFGHEYYYGQGIAVDSPGQTHHGKPIDIVDMGTTYLPLEVFVEYIDNQRALYTAEKYHLLDFNCNTFSNDVCQFLTGESIPAHITSLPAEFLQTPFGQSLLPMIEGMFGQSRLSNGGANGVSSSSAAAPPSRDAAALLQGVSASALSGAPAQPAEYALQTARDAASLDKMIQTYPAVAVFFTSATCPPCRVIKPDFERLIRDKNQGAQAIRILGVIVDTSVAFDAGAKYQVRATPTFMFFHKAQKTAEFRGANFAELQSSIDLLLFTAYPPHPHRKLHLREVCQSDARPILYQQPNKFDAIHRKLTALLDQDGITLDEAQNKTLSSLQQVLDGKAVMPMDNWQQLADTIKTKLPIDHQFPFLDFFSSLLLREEAGKYYTTNSVLLAKWFVLDDATPKATWMMTLRLACNVFSHAVLTRSAFTSGMASSHRAELTLLLINSLLAEDPKVRQTAASLAFNCSTVVLADRVAHDKGSTAATTGPSSPVPGDETQNDDDWHVELVSAVTDALAKEDDIDTAHRLLACIGNLLFLAPETSTVASLLAALDINVLLETKRAAWKTNTKMVALARDVSLILENSNE
ncbi:PPPDE putative peptidase domain-containing protein [Gongronella butleri]|nr:PPPDE putative peptidase domain-containing protein [Gongronella butleri]